MNSVVTKEDVVIYHSFSLIFTVISIDKASKRFGVNQASLAYNDGIFTRRQFITFLTCICCREYGKYLGTLQDRLYYSLESKDRVTLIDTIIRCGSLLPELYDNPYLQSSQVCMLDDYLQKEYKVHEVFVNKIEESYDRTMADVGMFCQDCRATCYLDQGDSVKGYIDSCPSGSKVHIVDFEPATQQNKVYVFSAYDLVFILAKGEPNPQTGQPFSQRAKLIERFYNQICMTKRYLEYCQ